MGGNSAAIERSKRYRGGMLAGNATDKKRKGKQCRKKAREGDERNANNGKEEKRYALCRRETLHLVRLILEVLWVVRQKWCCFSISI